MKNHLLAIGILSIVFTSCKKENQLNYQKENFSQDNLKSFGVIADDPALVAKVPMIISSQFLTDNKNTLFIKDMLRTSPVKGGGRGDNTPPAVSILSPSNGSSVSTGATVSINMSATDNKAVISLDISIDGALQNTFSSSTATFNWNTTNAASGTHTITATAKDAAGNSASTSILVTVNTTVINPIPVSTSGYQIKMPEVTTQGSEGSCAAFAIGYNVRSAEQYYKTNAASYSYAENIFSPEYLFNQVTVDANSCSGSSIYTSLEFLKNNGICTWQTMPYSTSNGCSLFPTTTQTAEAGNFKISSYAQVSTSDLPAIKTLLNNNHPLIISFMVDSYFYNAGPGFIWKSFSTTTYGRHAVAICGYDDAKHAVKIVNSWGTGWGDAGYTWIDYDLLPSTNTIVYAITL